MKPPISVTKTSNSSNFQKNLKSLGKKAVYVGIPTTNAFARSQQLKKISGGKGRRASRAAIGMSTNQFNNAELLYIFSKGSPLSHQPARPVIEPAIEDAKDAIGYELAESTKAFLKGDQVEGNKRLKRAGVTGMNASKGWFFNPKNQWAPNAPRTIAHKGSDRPGIDTAAMQGAITYVTKDEA